LPIALICCVLQQSFVVFLQQKSIILSSNSIISYRLYINSWVYIFFYIARIAFIECIYFCLSAAHLVQGVVLVYVVRAVTVLAVEDMVVMIETGLGRQEVAVEVVSRLEMVGVTEKGRVVGTTEEGHAVGRDARC